MAMNKREQAEMESLKQQLREAKALRFTEDVERDVPIPDGGDVSQGWDFCGPRQYNRVYEAWSKHSSHGTGQYCPNSGSQNGVKLFSTKLLALRALRRYAEIMHAADLAGIDSMIESESQKGGSP